MIATTAKLTVFRATRLEQYQGITHDMVLLFGHRNPHHPSETHRSAPLRIYRGRPF